MNEIWKDIPNYEGYYQVSNKGNIKSLQFQCNLTNKKYPREKILKQKIDKQKNKRVSLWKDGKEKSWLVHRLVGISFLGNTDESMTINHKDGNRLNNNVSNLEWCTLKENIQHGFSNNLYSHQTPIRIINKTTNKTIEYNSLSKGSIAIGKNPKYIYGKIKNNRYENNEYRWELI